MGINYLLIFVIVLPGLAIGGYLRYRFDGLMDRYSQLENSSSTTAREVGKDFLEEYDLVDISIEETPEGKGNSYDPLDGTVYLNEPEETSIAAVTIAAHEAAHAFQGQRLDRFFRTRSATLPVANLASQLGLILAFAGALFYEPLLFTGIYIYLASLLGASVFLPLEFDAGKRALAFLGKNEVLKGRELREAGKLLRTAALTHLASVAISFFQFLRRLVLVQP